MSKQEDVINRAYSNMPKEVGYAIDWNFIPTWRGVKYYWHKLIRKITRQNMERWPNGKAADC